MQGISYPDQMKFIMIVIYIAFQYNAASIIDNKAFLIMNRWILLTLSSLFMMNAQADNQFCGYKDYFHLSNLSHPAIYVVSGFSDQDIILQIIGPRSFIIRDNDQCQAGYAHVTVAYDSANWCVFDIKDGPFMSHPIVNASCNGIRYMGTEYDGMGSYSYTINLD